MYKLTQTMLFLIQDSSFYCMIENSENYHENSENDYVLPPLEKCLTTPLLTGRHSMVNRCIRHSSAIYATVNGPPQYGEHMYMSFECLEISGRDVIYQKPHQFAQS